MRFYNKDNSYTTIGFSSVLVVFVMLALTTFTVLAVVSANADYKLTKKVADNSSSYYSAEAEAEDILSQIDERLDHAYQSTGSLSGANVKDALSDLSDVTVETGSPASMVTYNVRINENSRLDVTLYVSETVEPGTNYYEITGWQLVNEETDTVEEDSITLLGE